MILSIIIFILIGALAGWLAGQIMKGGGFGFLINVLVGVAGAFLGSLVLGLLGIGDGGLLALNLWSIITAVAGACLLLFIISLIKKR